MKISLVLDEIKLHHQLIIKDLKLEVNEGLSFLVGPNGAGKTTLIHAILNLIPFKGNIRIGTLDPRKSKRKQLSRKVSFLPQSTRPVFPISVFEYVLMGRFPFVDWLGAFSAEDRNIVSKILHQQKLDHLAGQSIQTLSGGEWQKVLWARILVQDSPVCLLDEPTTALDPKNRRIFYEKLNELAKRKTILCSTHDLEAFQLNSARIIGIKKGKIVFDQIHPDKGTDLIEMLY